VTGLRGRLRGAGRTESRICAMSALGLQLPRRTALQRVTTATSSAPLHTRHRAPLMRFLYGPHCRRLRQSRSWRCGPVCLFQQSRRAACSSGPHSIAAQRGRRIMNCGKRKHLSGVPKNVWILAVCQVSRCLASARTLYTHDAGTVPLAALELSPEIV
jgi:hypothetical protein